MDHPVLVVLCCAPSEEVAVSLGKLLVDARLAACVNVVPRIRSIYRWQGAVHDEPEAQMVIKTTRPRLAEVTRVLVEAHPYELPEVIALDVADGHGPYLDWVREGTKP